MMAPLNCWTFNTPTSKFRAGNYFEWAIIQHMYFYNDLPHNAEMDPRTVICVDFDERSRYDKQYDAPCETITDTKRTADLARNKKKPY